MRRLVSMLAVFVVVLVSVLTSASTGFAIESVIFACFPSGGGLVTQFVSDTTNTVLGGQDCATVLKAFLTLKAKIESIIPYAIEIQHSDWVETRHGVLYTLTRPN